jgi:leucyl-tRNA synthetase
VIEVFDPGTIEPKWQERWTEADLYRSVEDPSRPKLYVLDMFPYPSAAGLHVGHPEGYTATDIIARMKRMQGFNVLHPMGWDAFGLPAENYALQNKVHPRDVTKSNIDNFRRQIKSIGFSYDWSREVDTTDPAYYRWTQWIFLQLFKKGLAYEGVIPINFCPKCKTGLANEEVHQGACERCGTPVERRDMRQWMLRITAYADRLLEDLEGLDWPESTLAMQRNWIGRSEGAEVVFEGDAPASAKGEKITVFTTRPDTLFGATYMVLSPEHPLVDKFTSPDRKAAVDAYRETARRKSDLERTDLAKEKTGEFTGGYAANPVNGEKVPVWIADYVLSSYGTGAIMAVPAHDERDFEFATKFKLPIRQVVRRSPSPSPSPARAGEGKTGEAPLPSSAGEGNTGAAPSPTTTGKGDTQPVPSPASAGEGGGEGAFTDEGFAVNSGPYDGLTTAEFKRKITAELEQKGKGKKAVNYRLRDWVFSRQRYWGEPIPVVHCAGKCNGPVPVPEEKLPVLLPDVKNFEPTGTGDSPLAAIESWVKTECPVCGGAARRETNTMPQWAGSCWYYLRFVDPKNDKAPWDKAKESFWLGKTGVDLYVGGAEHAVLHLLYSRFWHKVLFDLGLVGSKEPFRKLRHQGMVLSYSYQDKLGAYHSYDEIDFTGKTAVLRATGEALKEQVEKMSKSKKNVVSPDEIIAKYGADAMRLYEMFMGDFEQPKPWDMRAIEGINRFLQRVWRLAEKAGGKTAPDAAAVRLRHKTVQAVTERVEGFKFNTGISALMEYVNALYERLSKDRDAGLRGDVEALAVLIAPFAPHLAEEMWESLGHKTSVFREKWPEADPALLREDSVEYPVQVNGKVRTKVSVPSAAAKDAVEAVALAAAREQGFLGGQDVVKVIVVPGKMVSLVTRPIKTSEE